MSTPYPPSQNWQPSTPPSQLTGWGEPQPSPQAGGWGAPQPAQQPAPVGPARESKIPTIVYGVAAVLTVIAAALPWFTLVTAFGASMDHIFGTTSMGAGYSLSYNGWGIGHEALNAQGVEETEWGFNLGLFALTLIGVIGLIVAALLAALRQRVGHIMAIGVGIAYPLLISVLYGFGGIWDGVDARTEAASRDYNIFGVTVSGGTTVSDSAAFYLTLLAFLAAAGVGVWRLVVRRR